MVEAGFCWTLVQNVQTKTGFGLLGSNMMTETWLVLSIADPNMGLN
ncbi:hypothetical protein [Herpetosiphon llansteffanensis]|nr:hypothetical protein [Herpetosiphon llansteffanensis]